MISYVYETTNNINGMTYTGSTCENLLGGSKYLGSGKAFSVAEKEFGRENFTIKILAICPDRAFAYAIEDEIVGNNWTASTNYNLTRPSCGGMYGKPHSNESKEKMSLVQRGRKVSDETKQKLRESKLGTKLSDETKQKISEAERGEKHHMFGKHHSEQTKEKISKGNLGKTMSDEAKRKIGQSQIGRKHSEEAKQKMSEAKLGKKHSDETKQKIGQAGLGRKHSDEAKQKMSEAQKKRFKEHK